MPGSICISFVKEISFNIWYTATKKRGKPNIRNGNIIWKILSYKDESQRWSSLKDEFFGFLSFISALF